MGDEYLRLFVEETALYNRIVLGNLLPNGLWVQLPHYLQTWLRNYIAGTFIYLASGFLWCLYIYYLKRNVYVAKVCFLTKLLRLSSIYDVQDLADSIPSRKAMLLQIYVAMKAMPWYCILPTLSEYMVENGWTKCFSRISDIGWIGYLVYLIIYLTLVEFGIYWMHRELHDIKFLYKHLHATHHIYNKQNTLSPFAGASIKINRRKISMQFLLQVCISPTRLYTAGTAAAIALFIGQPILQHTLGNSLIP
ncbi:hypothetical protein EZV62_004993 [Acer yangbiense]|uniref:Fatty acid hydroxylase domain-containing protein n=1 Tax=Acer yangbiense TaxID=1000413 RepID=A0A5C7ILL5_9ROSI|nr:hypothetical protein EZV62_004993 [Acer yangbiense]